MSRILVTGGAGYIGSHTCVELLNEGHQVTVVDHLGNSSERSLEQVREITGKPLRFIKGDIRDGDVLDQVFAQPIDVAIHFAGMKAVGESVSRPLAYYQNNLDALMRLCDRMEQEGVRKMVFSSSATVYKMPATVPICESSPLGCTNPYGWTKVMCEQILRDLGTSSPNWSIMMLRYFNPVGAHPSGHMGEDPNGIPNNLMPYITQVAVGKHPRLTVNGDDYPTQDGTGVRDYIHVTDLAKGHCNAVRSVLDDTGVRAVNLGTGRGYSVLEVVSRFEEATGIRIPYEIGPRRPGDVAECYADPSLAETVLGWRAEKDIGEMCADAWRWQRNHPNGYAD